MVLPGLGSAGPLKLTRPLGRCGRWPTREPVVTEVMLPPSEAPACSPDATVAEALELLVQLGNPGSAGLRDDRGSRHRDTNRPRQAYLWPPGRAVRAGDSQGADAPGHHRAPGTPLPTIAKAIAEDGIIVVSGSSSQPEGYLTSELLLTQAPPGTSARPVGPGRPLLLIPGAGQSCSATVTSNPVAVGREPDGHHRELPRTRWCQTT